jgi:hypothetical protein
MWAMSVVDSSVKGSDNELVEVDKIYIKNS